MNRHKRLGVYLPALMLSIIATVTMRTIACFKFLDLGTGYFSSKTLIGVSGYVLVGAAIFLFTHLFFSEHKKVLIASFSGPETYIPTGLVVTALAFFAANSFSSHLSRGFTIDKLFIFNGVNTNTRILAIFELFLAIFAILAAVHFVLTALLTERASTARAAFGFFAVIFFTLMTIYLHFDPKTAINAPNKIVDQMAYLFVAIFFLYEIRISLGRELWAGYRTFGLIAALLSAYSSIPSLIYYLSGKGTISTSVYESALIFTFFIFIFCRLILSSYIKDDAECAAVTRLRAVSAERAAAIESREMLAMAAHTLENEFDAPEEEIALSDDAPDVENTEEDASEDGSEEQFEPIQLTFENEDGSEI